MIIMIDKTGWLALFHLYCYIYSQIEIDSDIYIHQSKIEEYERKFEDKFGRMQAIVKWARSHNS